MFGVAENTVRLSVGIEPVGQLIDDIKQALNPKGETNMRLGIVVCTTDKVASF
jgi:hypothetical protein